MLGLHTNVCTYPQTPKYVQQVQTMVLCPKLPSGAARPPEVDLHQDETLSMMVQ